MESMRQKTNKDNMSCKLITLLATLFVTLSFCSGCAAGGDSSANPQSAPQQLSGSTVSSDETIAELYAQGQSDVQVQGEGTVTRILADDTNGDRHQRFILELGSGQTLLVAHNTDLAPRLDGLAEGDKVEFYGEYYYNEQGGGIHWTHHDPEGEHINGWLLWKEEYFT